MFCVGGARAPASGASIMVCVGALSLKIFGPFLGSLAASATREERHRPGRFSESKQSASPRPVSIQVHVSAVIYLQRTRPTRQIGWASHPMCIAAEQTLLSI